MILNQAHEKIRVGLVIHGQYDEHASMHSTSRYASIYVQGVA